METLIKQLLIVLTPVLFAANLAQSFFYLPEAARREGGGHMPHALYYALITLFFGAMMFALVFILGIAIFQINRTFASTDTDQLNHLGDTHLMHPHHKHDHVHD